MVFRRPGERSNAVLLVVVVLLTNTFSAQGAPIRSREPRDLLKFLKDAGNAVKRAGESVLRAILPNVMKAIPDTKTDSSQKTTQPHGSKIPLNTISEDSINPVIPSKKAVVPRYGMQDSNAVSGLIRSVFTSKGANVQGARQGSTAKDISTTNAEHGTPDKKVQAPRYWMQDSNAVSGLTSSVLTSNARPGSIANDISTMNAAHATPDKKAQVPRSDNQNNNMFSGLISSMLANNRGNIKGTLKNEAVKEIAKDVQHFFYTG